MKQLKLFSIVIVGIMVTSLGAVIALTATPADAKWSGTWETLGPATGKLTSNAAVCSWSSGRYDVFARGDNGHLKHLWYPSTANPSKWSNWEDLGGGLASAPAAVSWGSGRIDVFVQGTDGYLWHKWYNGAWSGWENLGVPVTSAPAVSSWGAGRLDVFARAGGGSLYHKWYNGAWVGWENLGGKLTSAPAAVSWGPGKIDVLVQGTDGSLPLYHKWYTGGVWSSGPTGGWEKLGGKLTSAPAVSSWGYSRLDVFVRGTGENPHLYHKWFTSAWYAGWEDIGGTGTGGWAPAAISSLQGQQRIDVFVVDQYTGICLRTYWTP